MIQVGRITFNNGKSISDPKKIFEFLKGNAFENKDMACRNQLKNDIRVLQSKLAQAMEALKKNGLCNCPPQSDGSPRT